MKFSLFALAVSLLMVGSQVHALKRVTDDKYLISIVEATDAVIALKKAYGSCRKPEIRGVKAKGYVHNKSVVYRCKGEKDGHVLLIASTAISTWGKTAEITVEVRNIKGVSNLN